MLKRYPPLGGLAGSVSHQLSRYDVFFKNRPQLLIFNPPICGMTYRIYPGIFYPK